VTPPLYSREIDTAFLEALGFGFFYSQWLVAGGWWLVAGGWWLVAGGWWLVAVPGLGLCLDSLLPIPEAMHSLFVFICTNTTF
jgi:hypothetical protein